MVAFENAIRNALLRFLRGESTVYDLTEDVREAFDHSYSGAPDELRLDAAVQGALADHGIGLLEHDQLVAELRGIFESLSTPSILRICANISVSLDPFAITNIRLVTSQQRERPFGKISPLHLSGSV